MPFVSLIIPTYNEYKNIASTIHQVTGALKKATARFEIIVVDDDSPDGTWHLAEEAARKNPQLRVIKRSGERGLASAVVAGWKVARGEILGVMDGDLQHPPGTLPRLLRAMIDSDADIAIASRHVGGGGVSEWSLIRRCISWGATLLATVMLPGILRTVRDPMSGFFLMRRRVIASVNLRPIGYKILLEVLARGNYESVVEVPYVFEERRKGGSKLGPKQYADFLVHVGRLTWKTGQIARFARFCAVGASGIVVNLGVLAFLTEVGGHYYVHFSTLAVETAIVTNFILNDFWTFRDRSRKQPGFLNRVKRFWQFNVLCAAGAILNVIVFWFLSHFAGLHYLASQLVGIVVAGLWNYGINANVTWERVIDRKVIKFSGEQEGISGVNDSEHTPLSEVAQKGLS